MTRAVTVWDPFVRIVHWALALAFAVAYATAEAAPRVHEWAGYLALALVGLRLVWGTVGPRSARFTDFVRGPRAVLAYLGDLVRFRERRYLGHNPAGGWMVLALWGGIVLLSATGHWIARTQALPPEWLEELHEAIAGGMLGLIALHVIGVLHASLRHRENLVAAMVTGRKRRGEEPGRARVPGPVSRGSRPGLP